jgi:nitroimidazol reductase NimA-like FMN-containing flavoprotein (pyridoxamine 5'-phosphate oxidase superfamily)
VTVSIIDGFVMARTGFHHSSNYRSVMAFGRAFEVTDPAE